MLRQVVAVEALLGIESFGPASRLTLARSVEAGLPVAALEQFTANIAPHDARFKYRLVPEATLRRRIRSTGRLSTDESDRLVRLAKVFSFGLEIYGSPEKVREFLRRPHVMLEGRTPLDLALATSPGTDLIINLLGRVAYGGAV